LGATDDGGKLTAPGRQMAALGCEPRLAAMLTAGAALSADGLATAALLAALLEEPPRGGQMDIGYWLSRPQPNWRQRAAQLAKRLPQRAGQVDVDLAPRLLAPAFSDRIAQRRG
ncbi:ATP-dependent RNA helicase HrpB, partial [Klebsiella pneumoniae]|nr:ATP-dependent RNA helicase HrpB [Klebsiella pneumoniae]